MIEVLNTEEVSRNTWSKEELSQLRKLARGRTVVLNCLIQDGVHHLDNTSILEGNIVRSTRAWWHPPARETSLKDQLLDVVGKLIDRLEECESRLDSLPNEDS